MSRDTISAALDEGSELHEMFQDYESRFDTRSDAVRTELRKGIKIEDDAGTLEPAALHRAKQSLEVSKYLFLISAVLAYVPPLPARFADPLAAVAGFGALASFIVCLANVSQSVRTYRSRGYSVLQILSMPFSGAGGDV